MKEINLKGLDMTCYHETMENGLEVYLLPYKNRNNYFISYATRFGSDIVSFKEKDSKEYTPPLGIAHFLEHKMFEQESGEDPFSFFSKSGTDSNASTSFDNTQYICYGTKEFERNLEYLMNFVNSPYYTDSNVKKEKGIIAEEIKMYEDMPDFKLEMKTRECIYENHPRRIDIAGTIEEINKITKEDLYTCYKNFYVPNNMFLLIVGNFNKDKALEIIEKVQFFQEEKALPTIQPIKEKESVNQKEAILYEETIEVPKICYALKIPTKNLKKQSIELDLYLHMLTAILFGSSSIFKEKVREEKLMTGMYTEWETIEDYKVFYIMASTTTPEELIKVIQEELKHPKIIEKDLNRIKKVWIANEVKMIDNIDATVNNLYDEILRYKKVIPNRIDKIKNLKIKELNELINQINFENTSIVQMLPKKQ